MGWKQQCLTDNDIIHCYMRKCKMINHLNLPIIYFSQTFTWQTVQLSVKVYDNPSGAIRRLSLEKFNKLRCDALVPQTNWALFIRHETDRFSQISFNTDSTVLGRITRNVHVDIFIPCSVLILASDWLTTVKYGAVSHVWRHQREI